MTEQSAHILEVARIHVKYYRYIEVWAEESLWTRNPVGQTKIIHYIGELICSNIVDIGQVTLSMAITISCRLWPWSAVMSSKNSDSIFVRIACEGFDNLWLETQNDHWHKIRYSTEKLDNTYKQVCNLFLQQSYIPRALATLKRCMFDPSSDWWVR